MNPALVTLVNGKARIDDMDEDGPLVTFHGTAEQTHVLAEVFMRGLADQAWELVQLHEAPGHAEVTIRSRDKQKVYEGTLPIFPYPEQRR